MLTLSINMIPKAKQSMEYGSVVNKEGKIIRTQRKKKGVEKAENSIIVQIKNQLPKGFRPYENALYIEYSFRFPFRKTHSKNAKNAMMSGEKSPHKDTTPDLDNLQKLCNDAMQGIVFNNDGIIASIKAEKIYHEIPGVIIKLQEIE